MALRSLSDNDEPLFSDFQARLLSFLPCVTAVPSWTGSGLIIYVILRERRTLLRKTYHRIMLGLSFSDFVFSFRYAIFTGTWSIPEEATFVAGGRAKNFVPCSVEGFIAMFSLVSVLYTASLMVYFVLTLHFGASFEVVARRIEPWMHFFSILTPVVIGSLAAVEELMNPAPTLPGSCFLYDYPPHCTDNEDVDCTRGSNDPTTENTLLFVISALILASFVVILASMILLIRKVRRMELNMQQYAGGVLSQATMKRTQETAIRALLYIVAFFLFAIPTVVILITDQKVVRENRTEHFIIACFFVTLSLNQGFFNAIIYLRPRFHELISENGSLWFLWPFVSLLELFPCCVAFWKCRCCPFDSCLSLFCCIPSSSVENAPRMRQSLRALADAAAAGALPPAEGQKEGDDLQESTTVELPSPQEECKNYHRSSRESFDEEGGLCSQ